ncbi:MAG: hypothetical protein JRJ19_01460 [Deltaproteobacteria bacterium]|nr:hypothetical protein [Deltaproteobacteria bacterium]
MKNACVLLILIFLTQSGCGVSKKYFGIDEPEDKQVAEEEIDPPHNAIVFNTLFVPNYFLGSATDASAAGVTLEYHRSLTDYLGFSVAPEYLFIATEFTHIDGGILNGDGWGFQAGLRFFPYNTRLSKLYLSIVFGYARLHGTTRIATGNAFATVFEGGYAAVWRSGFTLIFGFGFDIRSMWWNANWASYTKRVYGCVRLVFSAGYSW